MVEGPKAAPFGSKDEVGSRRSPSGWACWVVVEGIPEVPMVG